MVSASSQTLEPQARSAVSLDLPSSLGGVGLGVVLGVAFAVALDRSRAAGWSSPRARQLGVLAVPVLALAAAELVGANVFLAAFLAGLAFGGVSRCLKEEPEVSQTVESAADVFGDVVWFLAGWLVVLTFSNGFRMQWLVLALVVLTVLRLVPVAIALLGCGFRRPTVLFVGWFGPRGVATIVFSLIAFISVFVHGITASPLAERYGAWAMRAHDAVENEPSVEPMPARGRHA
jgi:NhaP-type Na+/H+ or K+/H+ antiporter